MRKFIFSITGIALAVTIWTGCSSNECYDNHSALPLADFYSVETNQQVSINRLEIFGVGAPGDSILYYDESLSQAYLPFQLSSDTTTYVFAYLSFLQNGENVEEDTRLVPHDTIKFIYERKTWFVSPACGAMYFFDIEKVEHSSILIDSVYVDPVITNANASNIKIFFKSNL